MHALKNLRIDVEASDWLISQVVIRKMDHYTRSCYENSAIDFRETQSTQDILNFIKNKFQLMELTQQKQPT